MKQIAIQFFFIAVCICIAESVYPQQNTISIQFVPEFDSVPIEIGKKYPYKNDSIEIETLKFYISGISFFQDNKLVDEVEKKYHLIDMENPATQSIFHTIRNKKPFNHIAFSIGVDSITNEAGASGGDLDPTNGMYWEWRSGYINVKLEGRSHICPARKNQFTFHIGGYQYPFNTMQQINLPVADDNKIVVVFNVLALLNSINISELYEVMSPNEKAMGIAKKIGMAFNTVQ